MDRPAVPYTRAMNYGGHSKAHEWLADRAAGLYVPVSPLHEVAIARRAAATGCIAPFMLLSKKKLEFCLPEK